MRLPPGPSILRPSYLASWASTAGDGLSQHAPLWNAGEEEQEKYLFLLNA